MNDNFFAILLILWVIGWLMHIANMIVCWRKIQKNKKGLISHTQLFTKVHKFAFWGATILVCMSTLLFFIFVDATLIKKVKALIIVIITIPIQPMALICIMGYFLIFRENQKIAKSQNFDSDSR